MRTLITPHIRIADVLELEPARLRILGFDGLLLDLDNTLKAYRSQELRPEVIAWAAEAQAQGVALCLLSNGRPDRVRGFAERMGALCVPKAFKPLPFGCRAAQRLLGVPPNRVALVGDQIFADVLAGRLAGIVTILVDPLSHDEPWFTRLKRPWERRLLRSVPRSLFETDR